MQTFIANILELLCMFRFNVSVRIPRNDVSFLIHSYPQTPSLYLRTHAKTTCVPQDARHRVT